MQLEHINDLLRSAMDYQRTRAEVASFNLAMANVAIAPGQASPLKRLQPASVFATQLGLPQVQSLPASESATRVVIDPQHPLADEQGMVHYPKVDAALEMATLVSAKRAYEANIRAYNSLRAMTLKAFEIGK